MSVPRLKPTFIAGTPRSSGDAQTGQLNVTLGGGRLFTQFSGLIGGDAMIYSGAGRLDSITIINPTATSGGQTIFYDAAVVTSGGPFILSGHKVLGTIPNPTTVITSVLSSGAINPGFWPGTYNNGNVFQSGLAVAVARSGGAGFSVGFTPEATSLETPGTSVGA